MQNSVFCDKYRTRYLAFVDVLGFKALVGRTVKSKKSFNQAYRALTDIHLFNNSRPVRTMDGTFVEPNPGGHEPRVYTFSDHIALSSPPTSTGLVYLLRAIHSLYGHLLCNSNACIRGSVVKGIIADDNQVIFGPALIEAYNLENTEAKYPRIIIDKSIALRHTKELRKRYPHTGDLCWPGASQIIEDTDGWFMLDILASPPNCIVENSHGKDTWGSPTLPLWLQIVRQFIMQNLNTAPNSNIYSKYLWFAEYFNQKISAFPLRNIAPLNNLPPCPPT